MKPGTAAFLPLSLLSLLALTVGCAEMGGAIQLAGTLTGDSGLSNAGSGLSRAAEVQGFSEDEKVYTGRTVAANLLAQSRLSSNTRLEAYVGKLGQCLAQASGKADLPQGWHFILLADDDLGAYSCPGGIVMVEEKLVRLCRDEDELAGVLAHEIAHVALDHPMQAISAANQKAALLSLANVAYARASQGNDNLAGLTDQFKGVVSQVGEAVGHGYDRDKERAADLEAVRMTHELGYDPRGLSRVLRRLKAGDRSHGDPAQRADAVDGACAALGDLPTALSVRTVRFNVALQ